MTNLAARGVPVQSACKHMNEFTLNGLDWLYGMVIGSMSELNEGVTLLHSKKVALQQGGVACMHRIYQST